MNSDYSRKQLVSKCLSVLAEKSRDIFWIRSSDYSEQIYISPVFEKIWGISCIELYEDPTIWEKFLHPDDIKKMREDIKKRNLQVDENASFEQQYRIMRADHTVRWIKDSSFPIRDEKNQLLGFAGIAEDITEQKEHEIALEKAKNAAEVANEAKSVFIANMSHDLRTPLTGMLGISEILSRRLTNPKDKHYCHLLQQATMDLLELFNGILELLKSEMQGNNEFQTFDLRKVIDKVMNVISPTATMKRLELRVECDASVPHYLIGNQIFIHRILLNLVSNALKFTERGEVRIKARYFFDPNQKQYLLRCEVIDTGIGIPCEQHKIIFEQFTRLTPSYKGTHKGMGLGLYMVKQYLDQMHGTVTVKSEVGKGSCFVCEIPIESSLLEESVDSSRAFNKTYTSVQSLDLIESAKNNEPIERLLDLSEKKAKILVVEDQPIAQQVIQTQLQELNCGTECVDKGEEAIKLFKKNNYDLILMDIGLPGIDGLETTQCIRDLEKKINKKHTPIIANTAHATGEIKSQCLAAGMDAVLEKPLTFKALESTLRQYVQQDKMHQDLFLLNQTSIRSYKMIDLDVAALIVNSRACAEQYLKDFAKSLHSEQKEMNEAYVREDWQTLCFVAHRLHGALCYTAIPRLKAIVKEMEVAINGDEFEAIPAIYHDFLYQCKNFFAEFDVWMIKQTESC